MRLTALEGPNFSGRTGRLREWVGLPSDASEEAEYSGTAFIGLDPVGNLSGLVPTVSAEFDLLAKDKDAAAESLAALEALGFGHCRDRNPFSLSGGEQVVVAVLAALCGRPARLAIDCALEQLAPETRSSLLAYLDLRDGDLWIADNRLREWHSGPADRCTPEPDAPLLEARVHVGRPSAQVDLVDLEFAYIKGQPVFQGLNISFAPGRLHLLKGPNGSGKSTLSKILAGLLKPTGGEIRVDGRPVQLWKRPGTLASYHFQDPDLQLFSTRVGAQLVGCSSEVVATFGMASYTDHHPLDLPYVLRKRLAIAAAIGRDRPLIALDEPTLSQDATAAAAIRMVASGSSGLVISHSNVFDGLNEICLGGAI